MIAKNRRTGLGHELCSLAIMGEATPVSVASLKYPLVATKSTHPSG
jgi:hypothetical protein